MDMDLTMLIHIRSRLDSLCWVLAQRGSDMDRDEEGYKRGGEMMSNRTEGLMMENIAASGTGSSTQQFV